VDGVGWLDRNFNRHDGSVIVCISTACGRILISKALDEHD
jgi:hypothetical protein